MQLSDRKKLILQAVVNEYIDNAEPVGSKKLTENRELAFSSATIRNEMSELEEMGLLEQPHTSAGRVPSQAGFRMYVDSLMNSYRLSMLEMQRLNELMKERINELEKFLVKTSAAMSSMTNYPAIATMPAASTAEIKRIELLPVDGRSFLIVMVLRGGIIRNKLCRLSAPVPEESLRKLSDLINEKVVNRALSSVSLADTVQIFREMGDYGELVAPLLSYIAESASDTSPSEVMVEGAQNILRFPEYQDIKKAEELMSLLGDKVIIKSLVEPALKSDRIEVKIGKENNRLEMSGASIVLGNYRVGEKVVGAIGIIGPVRMDYSRVISHIEYFTGAVNKMVEQIFESEPET